MNDAALPKARADLDIRAAGGESVVHDPTNGMIHVLNAAAIEILRRCDGTTPVADVVDAIVARTGAARERVTVDVRRVCDDFRAKGLLAED